MTSLCELHPEELLDRARRSALTLPERRDLDAHLAVCAVCRLGTHVGAWADEPTSAAEAARAARLAARAAGTTPAPEVVVSRSGAAGRRWRWRGRVSMRLAVAAALAVALLGSASWALVRARRQARVEARPTHPVEARVTRPARRLASAAPAAPVGAEGDSRVGAPPVQGAPVDGPPDAPAKDWGPRAVGAGAPASGAGSTAALFAAGNQARRERRWSAAVALYAAVARRFPDSPEAATALILEGRVLLGELDRPLEARHVFDLYLRHHGDGPLREDALIGRALALEALGDRPGESAAWQTLLQSVPDSFYADHARARLQGQPGGGGAPH